MFQALTGHLPFESEALGDLFVKIIVAPLPVPSLVAPGLLPSAFDAWWAKAANRDPDLRYQTARDLSEGLAAVFGLSVELSDRSLPTSSGAFPFIPVRIAASPVSGVAHVPTAASSAPTLAGEVPVEEATSPPMARTFGGTRPEPPKRRGASWVLGGVAFAAVAGTAGLFALKSGRLEPYLSTPAQARPPEPPVVLPAPSATAPVVSVPAASAPPSASAAATASAASPPGAPAAASPPPRAATPPAASPYRKPAASRPGKKPDDLGI